MRVVLVLAALLVAGELGALGGLASAQSVAAEGEVPTAQLALTIDPALTTCPSERVIRRTVAAHLGWNPFRPAAAVRIVASLRRDGDAIEAYVAAYDEDGSPVGDRTVRSETLDCAEVARALALAISVAVDPFVMTRAGGTDVALVADDPGTESGAGVVAPEGEGVGPDDSAQVPPRSSGRRWVLGCELGAALGAVPAPRPYVGFAVERALERGGLRAAVRHDFQGAADGVSGGRVRASRTRLELGGCVTRGGFLACGNVALGLLHATGAGVSSPRRAQALVPSLGVALGFRHALGEAARLSWLLGVDVPLIRAALEVQYEVAFTLPPASPSLGLRLEWGVP